MIAIGSRESVIQNLEDAGCEPGMIEDFLGWFDKGQQTKQLELLEHQREYLLGRVHTDEKRISCLDYLIYQIQGKPAGKDNFMRRKRRCQQNLMQVTQWEQKG